MNTLIVTGTDTGVGKTIFSAGLAATLGTNYWKPIQSGLEGDTDSQIVSELSGQPVLPEAYRLNLPASPHIAAEQMGITIDLNQLTIPKVDGQLVIEGAGGVMVPLTRQIYYLDLFAKWQAPVILVARTALGTINHTSLSLMALRNAGCPVVGVAYIGEATPQVEDTITQMCKIPHLGRLDLIEDLNRESLLQAFKSINQDVILDAL